jgi:hypothetical protein
VRVLNEKEGEETGHEPVDWDGLATLEDTSLLADDMFKLTETQYAKMTYLLSYRARHHNVDPVVLVCHSVLKNNVFGLLTHLTHVLFTFHKGNARSLGKVCSEFLFTRQQRNAMVETFLATKEKYGHYVLDVEARTFVRGDHVPPPPSAGPAYSAAAAAAECRKTAEAYLPLFCSEPKRAISIFEFIVAKIPIASLRPDDLSLALRRKESGVEIRLSLIDYLHVLCSQEKPSGDQAALHRYLARYVQLPRCFIKNKFLLKTGGGEA